MTRPRPAAPRWQRPLRLLLVLPAALALGAGVLCGLARLGVRLPLWLLSLSAVHGALMIGGFFGTLIGLERAVALSAGWTYLVPALSGLAVFCLFWQPYGVAAPLALTTASLLMTLACLRLWHKQPAPHLATLAAAAFAWLAGNCVWLATDAIPPAIPAWTAFLVLTIAGERLELTRMQRPERIARQTFPVIVVLQLTGALLYPADARGLTVFALGLAALAGWLLRYDIARRNLHARGLTRYMAICLFTGYLWLGGAALLGLAGALTPGSPLRDAALHALFLGFVFAMVCGHAPIIVPALTRLRLRWHRGFYLPLALLYATLALRVIAGMRASLAAHQWAAIGNALTLALFAVLLAESLIAARRSTRQPAGGPQQ